MAIPTPEQFQKLVDGIKSDSYFSKVGYDQGVMVLRVKGPECQYQGVHFVISPQGQNRLVDIVEDLKEHKRSALKLEQPNGRPWVELVISRIDISPWLNLQLTVTDALEERQLLLDFLPQTICISGNERSMKKLLKVVTDGKSTGQRLDFDIARAGKTTPVRNPLSIWIWRWPDQRIKRS